MRAAQLDKEAGELRDENTALAKETERLRNNAAAGARVRPYTKMSEMENAQALCAGMSIQVSQLGAAAPSFRAFRETVYCRDLQRLYMPASKAAGMTLMAPHFCGRDRSCSSAPHAVLILNSLMLSQCFPIDLQQAEAAEAKLVGLQAELGEAYKSKSQLGDELRHVSPPPEA